MRLPRPILDTEIFEVEIKKPDTDVFLKAAQLARENKFQNAAFCFIQGSITEIDNAPPTIQHLKNIPLVSGEIIVKEAFKLYGVDTKVESVHKCPRCGSMIINEQVEEYDNRFDIDNLEIINSEDGEPYILELVDPIILNGSKGMLLEIYSQTYRDICFKDLLKVENDPTLKSPISQMKRSYYECLIDLDGKVGAELSMKSDIDSLKKVFPFELLSFPDMRDFNNITKTLRKFGIQNNIDLVCDNCKKKFKDRIEFTSFFVSSLLSE